MRYFSKFISVFLVTIFVFLCGCKKQVKFDVNFIVDDALYATVGTSGDEVISIPTDPVKGGFVFDGWYWDKDVWQKPFSANSLLDVELRENMNVYAKFLSNDDPVGCDLVMEGFDNIVSVETGDILYGETPNAQINFSFDDVVRISNKSTYTVSTDLSGNDIIKSKTTVLELGNNLFFIQVYDDTGKVKQYNIVIRRHLMYKVTFNTNGGTSVSSKTVEEDSIISVPNTTRTGYVLKGWDYDFSEPIVENTTISAIWEAKEYIISLDANDGNCDYSQLNAEYNTYLALPTPTKAGYTFNGWYNETTRVYDGVWKTDKNVELTAKWTANTYTISYDLDGGTLNSNKPSSYKTGQIVNMGNPSKVGYEFLGWSVNGSSQKYKDYQISDIYGNISLVAYYEANTYSVTLDSDGGDCETNLFTVTYGKNYTLPVPTKVGYIFEGWYNGSTKVEAGVWNRTYSLDLKAKWSIANYTITYNLNGGCNNENNPTSFTFETETIILLDATKTGYTFVGWTSSDITTPTKNVIIEKGSTENVKFTANFTANKYNVIFDVNGGSELEENDLEVIYDNSYTLPKTEKTGYKFKGWYNGEELVNDGIWKMDSNVTLTAKWEIITYKINYELNGGVNSNQNLQNYNYEYSDISIYNPTKTGYTFIGWKVNGEEELVIEYVVKHNSLGNITLEAIFTPNTYKLTLDVNGGNSLEKDEIEIKYDEKLSLEVPNRTGYTFAGWYKETSKVENGTWKYLEDVTLTAKWNIINYTIKYNLDDGVNSSSNVSGYTYESDDITISEPTKTGYTFLGWTYGDIIVPEKEVVISHNSTGDIELNAYFQVNTYYITYDVNGGNELDQNVVGIVYGTNFSLITPTKDGYEFSGWYIDSTKFVSGKWTKTNDVTLTAKWTLVNYSISYILDGGKSSYNPAKYNYEYQDIVISNPTKTGYTFIGWSINDSTDLYIDYVIKQHSFGNLVLKANWQVNEYKLSLDINGGNELDQDVFNIEYGSDFSLPEPSRTGYTFGGWYNGKTKVENGTWKYLEDVTLTAKWNVINYNIKYYLNDATINDNPLTYTYDDDTIVLNDPYKKGHTFIGWITDSVFIPTKALEIPHNSLGEFSFEAIFEVNTYLITLDVNGGDQLDINEMEIVYAEKYELPIPQNADYLFSGWYYDNVLLENIGDYYFDKNITIIAKWTIGFFENGANYCYFGKYPQSIVNEENLINELNKITITNEQGYVVYNNEEYYCSNARNIYDESIKGHRPILLSNGQTLHHGEKYWFKVEPIKWEIINNDGKSLKLICETILEQLDYNIGSGYYRLYYYSSYIESQLKKSIQKYYQDLFSNDEREKILLNNTYDDYIYIPDKDIMCTSLSIKASDYAQAHGCSASYGWYTSSTFIGSNGKTYVYLSGNNKSNYYAYEGQGPSCRMMIDILL